MLLLNGTVRITQCAVASRTGICWGANKVRVYAPQGINAYPGRPSTKVAATGGITGRSQSFFLQQMIESGIAAIEATWLPPDVLAQVRSGTMPPRHEASDVMSDLFDGH